MSSPYIDENQNIIAVMGTTGVGKSTFINFATGGEAMIGDNLESCKIMSSKHTVYRLCLETADSHQVHRVARPFKSHTLTYGSLIPLDLTIPIEMMQKF